MTRHARTAYRRHRKAGIATFVLVFAVGLVVASYPAAAEPPPLVAGTQVNLGGQASDCTALTPDSAATHDFRVTNPSQSGQFVPYTDPNTGATFEVKVTVGNTKLEFRLVGSGYHVNDLVIKGGAKSMHYDYDAASLIVTADSNLTGPPKGNTTYSISHVTFCYSEALAKIEGKVWRDHDESGTQDDFELGQGGWRVTVTGAGLSRTVTTAADNPATLANESTYVVDGLPLGQTYTVCETKPVGDPDTWTQSVPSGACALAGAESKAHVIDLEGDVSGADFGNVRTTFLQCDGPNPTTQVTIGGQTISLANCTKTGLNEYVFETYLDGDGNQIVNFHPAASTGGTAATVEKLNWVIDATQGSVLKYDDNGPTQPPGVEPMLKCQYNPLNTATPAELDLIAPLPGAVLPGTHTSCLITSTETSPVPGTTTYTRVDYVYSEIDGLRIID